MPGIKRLTVRRSMAVIALIAVSLAVVANERWRWGYPLRVPYDKSNAVGWMATVIRSDHRKYEGSDVYALINDISTSGVFVGKTRGQVVAQLGPPETKSFPSLGVKGKDLFYSVGTVPPPGYPDGPPMLVFHFNAQGKCIRVVPYGSW